MDTFLAVLMALGIFVGIPVIIGITIVGIYSGLFRVIGHNMRRKFTASRRRAARIPEETMPEKITR